MAFLAIRKPINGEPASHGDGSTNGFAAADASATDAWHKAGLVNGGTTWEDHPEFEKVQRVRFIWPTCVIHLAIKFAPFIEWLDPAPGVPLSHQIHTGYPHGNFGGFLIGPAEFACQYLNFNYTSFILK
jgi:hypothetical protein